MFLTTGGARSKNNVEIVQRSALHGYPVPTREDIIAKTGNVPRTWKPINHGVLADYSAQAIENLGIEILEERWMVCREGNGLIGEIEVLPNLQSQTNWTDGIQTFGNFQAQQLGMHVVIRHSNDQVWALRFLAGAKVLVCSNGMAVTKFGDIKIKKKHSKHMDTWEYIQQSIKAVCLNFGDILNAKGDMESVPITGPEGDYLAVEAARRGVMPWSLIKGVVGGWRAPAHEEFKPRNGWSLYNAFTDAFKKRTPSDQLDSIAESSNLILEYGAKTGYLKREDDEE